MLNYRNRIKFCARDLLNSDTKPSIPKLVPAAFKRKERAVVMINRNFLLNNLLFIEINAFILIKHALIFNQIIFTK